MTRCTISTCLAALAAAVRCWAPASASAQKPVSQSAAVSKTFTIDAIDHSNRLLTLRDEITDTLALAISVTSPGK